MTLPCQYIYENIMFVRKNIALFRKKCDFQKYNTRNKDKLIAVSTRLRKVQKSFMGLCTLCYNKLPNAITNMPENKFKTIVKQTLSNRAYYKLDDYLLDKHIWTDVIPPVSDIPANTLVQ